MMRQFLTLILAANLADVRATRKHPAMAMQEVLNHDIKKAPGFSENPGINHNKYINLEQWQKMTTIQEIVQGRPMEQCLRFWKLGIFQQYFYQWFALNEVNA